MALAWWAAYGSIRAHRAASQARVETLVESKAALITEELRRELLVADQTLHILELEWERDPARFNFESWRRRVMALNDISLQIFITDANGIVRASSRPKIIGDNVSHRDYFRARANLAADDGRMIIGALTRGLVTRDWQLNLVRRLDHADGSFAGVIAASYDAAEFGRLQRDAGLGQSGLLIVSTLDGAIRGVGNIALADSADRISDSAIFATMKANREGHWAGRSPLDGIDRILAFTTIPDRGLQVLVGVDRAEGMHSADEWERQAVVFTVAATALLLLMALVLLWAERAARARHSATIRERAELADTNVQLEAAEARERAKSGQLEAALSGMSDGIMMVDAEMRLLAWNARFPRYTGVPEGLLRSGVGMEEMLRAQAAAGEFGPVDVEWEVTRRMLLLGAGGSTGTVERQRPDGRILEIRRDPLPGGGFVTLYSDITSRRHAEDRARQAQTMAAIGRLTSGVAHDFNNLLASVSANAEMLLRDLASSPKQVRRLSIVLEAARRGAELVKHLLAFARKQALAAKPVDINLVLDGLGELLKSTLGATVQLDMQFGPDLWPAMVDRVQAEHVLINLAINARDAMPTGGVVTITTNNSSFSAQAAPEDLSPGDYVMIAVSDTGMGMSEEVLRNAFEPFFTTKPPGRGSGLGLSQVYGLTRQSGGGVRIESELSRGTTVRLFLPRAPDDAAVESTSDVTRGEAQSRRPHSQRSAESAIVLSVNNEDNVGATIC